MDCPCGSVRCTCKKNKCKGTKGCICLSCSEWISKCRICGLQILASYFSDTNSTADKEPNVCQCFMTSGINSSSQAQASAECEGATAVIPISSTTIGSSLTLTERLEKSLGTENENSDFASHAISLSQPHAQYETDSICTYVRFPVPAGIQSNQHANFSYFRRAFHNPHQQCYRTTHTRSEYHDSQYYNPIMNSSTRTSSDPPAGNRVALTFYPSHTTSFDYTPDYTLLPEGTTDQQRRRNRFEQRRAPFYPPEENLRQIFPQYYKDPRPPMVIPYRRSMRRNPSSRYYSNRPSLPKGSIPTKERIEKWLKENFPPNLPNSDSPSLPKSGSLLAELPIADCESTSSAASTSSTSLAKYFKDGKWSGSGSDVL